MTPTNAASPSNDKLVEMARTLERMRGPGDGLGAYLGDGITLGEPIRARVLAQCLRELCELRQKNG